MRGYQEQPVVKKVAGMHSMERLGEKPEESYPTKSNGIESETKASEHVTNAGGGDHRSSIGGPSTWDPYSKGIDLCSLRTSLASSVTLRRNKEQKESRQDKRLPKVKAEEPVPDVCDIAQVRDNDTFSVYFWGSKTEAISPASNPRLHREWVGSNWIPPLDEVHQS
ncbi:hypothetical protein NE237_001381 [Protea cynaroides]|uniref:Uncharacterized protein n=1 Tax=Protea cynaroides TaxID=273540 RepID=A0A9Q0QYF0_9MAGN|nr:hypothetical protein NE237_001381 [Protea cynaroides]